MSGVGGPIASVTYMMPPMTRTADIDALEAWMVDGDSAERILIAEGRVEPRSALGWLLAQQWASAGLIAILVEPGEGRERRWIAERRVCAMPMPVAAGRRSGAATEPIAPNGEPMSDFIRARIKRAANFNQPAPSLADLARAGGMKSPANAKYYVDKLKRERRLDFEDKVFAGGSRRRYFFTDSNGVVTAETKWGR